MRLPSAFTMTFGSFPSMTATTELVVPRSMPMIFPITCSPSMTWSDVSRPLSSFATYANLSLTLLIPHAKCVPDWMLRPLSAYKKSPMIPVLLLSVLLGSPIRSASAPAPPSVVGDADPAASFAAAANGATILAAWRDGDVMNIARLYPWLTADPRSEEHQSD